MDGEQVGILIRAGEGETDEALVDGVAVAARLALANARLQNQARQRIQELAESRLRLVEAADAERSRIHQELDVGVGQRLTKAEALLSELAEDGDPSDATQELLDEVRSVNAELSDFTAGIGSGSLVADGLGPAVAGLVAALADPDRHRHPGGSLANARGDDSVFRLLRGTRECRQARPCIPDQRPRHATTCQLDLEILDDGHGGADTAGGSGLRGLADRVEAIGGSLRVEDSAQPEDEACRRAAVDRLPPSQPGDRYLTFTNGAVSNTPRSPESPPTMSLNVTWWPSKVQRTVKAPLRRALDTDRDVVAEEAVVPAVIRRRRS